MYELSIEQHFHAAHCIDGHPGKCARLHGHTYVVRASIAADELDDLGMVMDFAELRRILAAVLEELDHRHLNELDSFVAGPPTAERLAEHIASSLQARLRPTGPWVRCVRISESPGATATYHPPQAGRSSEGA